MSAPGRSGGSADVSTDASDPSGDAASAAAELRALFAGSSAGSQLLGAVQAVLAAEGNEAESARRELHAFFLEHPELAGQLAEAIAPELPSGAPDWMRTCSGSCLSIRTEHDYQRIAQVQVDRGMEAVATHRAVDASKLWHPEHHTFA